MFTWNINWINPYESPWSISNKFMTANCVTGRLAAECLTSNPKITLRNKVNNFSGNCLNTNVNDDKNCNSDFNIFNYGVKILEELFDNNDADNTYKLFLAQIIDKSFKYCPTCLESGFHAIYHQFSFLSKCPIHDCDLLIKCPNCKHQFLYMIYFKKEFKPYICYNCNNQIINSEFSSLINEWNNNKYILKFKPFQFLSNSKIFLFRNFEANNPTTSKRINYALYELFNNQFTFNKISIGQNEYYQFLMSNAYIKKKLHFENGSLSDMAYIIALKYVSKHIKKKYKINNKVAANIHIYDKLVYTKSLNIEQYLSEKRVMLSLMDLIYFLWKRNLECPVIQYSKYVSNDNNDYSPLRFSPNNYIYKYLRKIEHDLTYYDITVKNIDKILKILIVVSMQYMLILFSNWNDYINNLLTSKNVIELISEINYIDLPELLQIDMDCLLIEKNNNFILEF